MPRQRVKPVFIFQDAGSGDMFGDDPICKKLLADQEALALIDNTQVASDVDYKQSQVVFFPGQFPLFSFESVKTQDYLG